MSLYNLARVNTATAGTGTVTLGSAVSGFLTFTGAGVVDGSTVSYGIRDDNHSEVGRGVWDSATNTLTRASILNSTLGGAAINLSGNAEVFITALAQDIGGHTQNTDTGTTNNTFTIDSDSTTGKIILDVALGAADKSLTITNDALTDDRIVTFQDVTGTVALTSDLTAYIAKSLLTEQGDIIYASAASTPAALAHGNAGAVLVSGGHGANPSWGALIAPATNVLTLTNAAASTLALAITSGKTLTLTATNDFNLTIPATGTAALLQVANVFTVGGQMVDSTADAIELRLQAHSTKTTSFFTIEKSDGTVWAGIDSLGRIFSYGKPASNLNCFINGAGNGTLTGTRNVGIGDNCLTALTSGLNNYGFGSSALQNLQDGSNNIGVGPFSLLRCISASYNTGVGYSTLQWTNANANTAIGYQAGNFTTGGYNVTVGYWSGGFGAGSQQYTNNNVCIGAYSGYNISRASGTQGANNIYIGYAAGYNQTTGQYLLIVDSTQRASAAVEFVSSIVYGVMGATPGVQTLRLNAVTTIAVDTTTNNAPLTVFDLLGYVSTASTGFANGGGVAQTFTGETATDGTSQLMARIAAVWTDATNATRKAKLQLSAYDTAIRTGIEISANGTTPDITLLGDTWFVGAGFGLPYGSFYGNELSATYAVNNSYMRIADTGCVTGEVNLVTYTDAGTTLTISKAGVYKIDWSVSVEATSANIHILGGIMIDSTTVLQAAGKNHFETTIANRQMAMSGTAIISCPNGTEVIGVGVGSDANTTLTVDHVNLSIVQIGA